MSEETEDTISLNQKAYIKLIKNTKNYNWEIKVLDETKDMDKVIAEIKRIDKELKQHYGELNNE